MSGSATTCYKTKTCEEGGYYSAAPSGQTCEKINYNGSTCYTNCQDNCGDGDAYYTIRLSDEPSGTSWYPTVDLYWDSEKSDPCVIDGSKGSMESQFKIWCPTDCFGSSGSSSGSASVNVNVVHPGNYASGTDGNAWCSSGSSDSDILWNGCIIEKGSCNPMNQDCKSVSRVNNTSWVAETKQGAKYYYTLDTSGQPICSDGGYYSSVPSGQTCDTVDYKGLKCYTNCKANTYRITAHTVSHGYLDKQGIGDIYTDRVYSVSTTDSNVKSVRITFNSVERETHDFTSGSEKISYTSVSLSDVTLNQKVSVEKDNVTYRTNSNVTSTSWNKYKSMSIYINDVQIPMASNPFYTYGNTPNDKTYTVDGAKYTIIVSHTEETTDTGSNCPDGYYLDFPGSAFKYVQTTGSNGDICYKVTGCASGYTDTPNDNQYALYNPTAGVEFKCYKDTPVTDWYVQAYLTSKGSGTSAQCCLRTSCYNGGQHPRYANGVVIRLLNDSNATILSARNTCENVSDTETCYALSYLPAGQTCGGGSDIRVVVDDANPLSPEIYQPDDILTDNYGNKYKLKFNSAPITKCPDGYEEGSFGNLACKFKTMTLSGGQSCIKYTGCNTGYTTVDNGTTPVSCGQSIKCYKEKEEGCPDGYYEDVPDSSANNYINFSTSNGCYKPISCKPGYYPNRAFYDQLESPVAAYKNLTCFPARYFVDFGCPMLNNDFECADGEGWHIVGRSYHTNTGEPLPGSVTITISGSKGCDGSITYTDSDFPGTNSVDDQKCYYKTGCTDVIGAKYTAKTSDPRVEVIMDCSENSDFECPAGYSSEKPDDRYFVYNTEDWDNTATGKVTTCYNTTGCKEGYTQYDNGTTGYTSTDGFVCYKNISCDNSNGWYSDMPDDIYFNYETQDLGDGLYCYRVTGCNADNGYIADDNGYISWHNVKCGDKTCSDYGYEASIPSGQTCSTVTPRSGLTCYKDCKEECTPSCKNETNCQWGSRTVSNGCGGTCTKCYPACQKGYKYNFDVTRDCFVRPYRIINDKTNPNCKKCECDNSNTDCNGSPCPCSYI